MFKSFRRYILSTLILVNSTSIFSSNLSNLMCRDFQSISNVFATSYAPSKWKNEHFGWSIENEIQKVESKVCNSNKITIKEYQKILKNFFDSTKDYHVGYQFYSTEKSFLPFSIKGVNGRYFISYIDRKIANENQFPFIIGDEIIEFDGKPINEAVLEFLHNNYSNTYNTDLELAQIHLTSRNNSRLEITPKGSVRIKVKEKVSNETKTIDVKWTYSEEKINNKPKVELKANNNDIERILKKELNHKMSYESGYNLEASNPHSIGNNDGFLPDFGSMYWDLKGHSEFKAYIYKDNGKRIGYIRIPTYSVDSEYNSLKGFMKIITLMEYKTDALIIDQVNNPGGSVNYLYNLASTLSTKDLEVPKHLESLNQETVFNNLFIIDFLNSIDSEFSAWLSLKMAFGDYVFGNPISLKLVNDMKSHFSFMVNEWNSGKTLTSAANLYGVKSIKPNPSISYSKPLVILTNGLDFSGGDFFPAIMQDNKRAKIIGTRTAGAGGYVKSVTYPNIFGLAYFSYTGSIAERLNHSPIENLGVTPDVEIPFTENDLQNNYTDYVKAVNQEVHKLIS